MTADEQGPDRETVVEIQTNLGPLQVIGCARCGALIPLTQEVAHLNWHERWNGGR